VIGRRLWPLAAAGLALASLLFALADRLSLKQSTLPGSPSALLTTREPPPPLPTSPPFISLGPGSQTPPFANLAEFEAQLSLAVGRDEVDPFWASILALRQMPLIFGDTAVFLYRGQANTIAWRLDWTISDRGEWMGLTGERQGDSDIWLLKRPFPADTRLSYHIVRNEKERFVDPLNSFQRQESGGPASELRMPDYIPPAAAEPRPGVPSGTLSPPVIIDSRNLPYSVRFQVYTPADYPALTCLPVLYVVDGHEYADDELGALLTILDNLIADGEVEPLLAVLIDGREPSSGSNLRFLELTIDAHFNAFLTTELVPAVDLQYRTQPSPEGRAILGANFGALQAAGAAYSQADIFGLLAMQSPTWIRHRMYHNLLDGDPQALRVFYSVGTMGDASLLVARNMRDALRAAGYPLHYLEVNDGASWGNYRGTLDDLLRYLFPRRSGPSMPDELSSRIVPVDEVMHRPQSCARNQGAPVASR
jgi:enterochelin esterase-like enzyme